MITCKKGVLFVLGTAFLLCVCVLLLYCVHAMCIASVELMPDIEWQLVRFKKSRIIWGDKGVVAEGDLLLTFCDDGIDVMVCDRKQVVYLDVVNDAVLSSDGSFIPLRSSDYIKGRLISFCAESVMGPYGRISLSDFKTEKEVFVGRIIKRLSEMDPMGFYDKKH